MAHISSCPSLAYSYLYQSCQPWWLSGLTRSRVHSLWLLVDHCVLRNWDRILVRAVKGLISRAGMVSICPLLWQRDVKLQQTTTYINPHIISFTSPILISGARDNIFRSHITSPQYTSAAFNSLAPTDDSRRTLSLYSMSFYRRWYAGGKCVRGLTPTGLGRVISWALVGGQAAPSVFELGHRRRGLHLRPAAQSNNLPF